MVKVTVNFDDLKISNKRELDKSSSNKTGTIKAGVNKTHLVALGDKGEWFIKQPPKTLLTTRQMKELLTQENESLSSIPVSIAQIEDAVREKEKRSDVSQVDIADFKLMLAELKKLHGDKCTLLDVKLAMSEKLITTGISESLKTKLHHTIAQGLEASDKKTAIAEQISQEFFALMNPHQPRLLRAINEKGELYVLSQKVEGFKELGKNFDTELPQHFGDTLVYSLLVQEADMHKGNIGLDDKGRVVKIDGDWSFAELRNNHDDFAMKINTFQTIERLPRGPDNAEKWLLFASVGSESKQRYPFQHMKLESNPEFRQQVNSGLLKVSLLTNEYIEQFIKAYAEDEEPEPFTQLFSERSQQLKDCALLNLDFYNYMQSDQAELDLAAHLESICGFKINDSIPVLSSERMKAVKERTLSMFQDLKSYCKKNYDVMVTINDAQPNRVLILANLHNIEYRYIYSSGANKKFLPQISEWKRDKEAELGKLLTINNFNEKTCATLHDEIKLISKTLDKLADFTVDNQNDVMLKDWLNKKQVELSVHIFKKPADINSIQKIDQEIEQVKKSLASPEVKRVKEEINRINEKQSFLKVGAKNKADMLREALYSIPPHERGTVLSSKTSNLVQRVIATGSFALKLGILRETDSAKTTQSFRSLKKEFQSNNDNNAAPVEEEKLSVPTLSKK